jgi:tetratricopeptide (TPR) repeat protein
MTDSTGRALRWKALALAAASEAGLVVPAVLLHSLLLAGLCALLLFLWNVCAGSVVRVNVLLWAAVAFVPACLLVGRLYVGRGLFRRMVRARACELLARRAVARDPAAACALAGEAVAVLEPLWRDDITVRVLYARCCNLASVSARLAGLSAQAEQFSLAEIDFMRLTGNSFGEADALRGLANLRHHQGRLAEAEEALTRGLEVVSRGDFQPRSAGDYASSWSRGVVVASAAEHRELEAFLLDMLGQVVHERGRPAETVRYCRRAVEVYPCRDGAASLMHARLAGACRDVGRWEEAAGAALAGIELARAAYDSDAQNLLIDPTVNRGLPNRDLRPLGQTARGTLALMHLTSVPLLLGDQPLAAAAADEVVRTARWYDLGERFTLPALVLRELARAGTAEGGEVPPVPSRWLARRLARGPFAVDSSYPLVPDMLARELSGSELAERFPDQARGWGEWVMDSFEAAHEGYAGNWDRLDRLCAAHDSRADALPALVLSRIGWLFDRRGMSAAAGPWHERAEAQARREGDVTLLVIGLLRQGASHRQRHDREAAARAYGKAAVAARTAGLAAEWAAACLEWAAAEEEQGDPAAAVGVLDEVLGALGGDPVARPVCIDGRLARGRCLARVGRLEEAVADLRAGLLLARDVRVELSQAGLRTRVKPGEVAAALEHLVALHADELRDVRRAVELVEWAKLWEAGGNWLPPSQALAVVWGAADGGPA